MAIYLVDYENTHNLCGVSQLTVDDTVVVFYTQNSASLSFEAHKEILASGANIDYKYVDVGGKNALDFQLSSYLGYLVGNPDTADKQLFIVSKDRGFFVVSKFWEREKHLKVAVVQSLNEQIKRKSVAEAAAATVTTVAEVVGAETSACDNCADTTACDGCPEVPVVNNQAEQVPNEKQPVEEVACVVSETDVSTETSVRYVEGSVEQALADSGIAVTEHEIDEIAKLVGKYKSMQTINNHINKLLKDSAKSGALLKVVKPFVKK